MWIKDIVPLQTNYTPRTVEHRRLIDGLTLPNSSNNNSRLRSYYKFSDLSIKFGFMGTRYMTVSPTDTAVYTYKGLDYVKFINKNTGATLSNDTCRQLTLWCICNLN